MARTGLIVYLLLALTLARAGSHPPRTVVQYYLLLPSKYFGGLAADTRKERMHLILDRSGSVVDVDNGYLHVKGDGAQPELTVCIFRRPNQDYVAAVNSNDN